MMDAFHYMRLRKAPYTEFRRVSTSLDDYASVDSSPVFLVNNIPIMDMELKENDLISFMNPHVPAVPIKECGQEWHLHQDHGEWHSIQGSEVYLQ